MSLIDAAASILSRSERRLELAASNVANAATPGYKRAIAFETAVGTSTRVDVAAGKLTETGDALDLSFGGEALLAVRRGEELVYAASGRLHRDPDGRILTRAGDVAQTLDGGDLAIGDAALDVAADGTILVDDRPVGRLALFEAQDPSRLTPVGGGAFRADDGALAPAADVQVRQGAYETSNVSLGEEMVAMMEALRRAETGQRLASTYDDLMGRLLTTLGRA